MLYKITPFTKSRAKKLHVIVRPSKKANFKIDVFDASTKKYITSVGARNYKDFPTFQLLEKQKKVPPGYAATRRRLYHMRHKKDASRKYSRGFYASNLLW